MSSVAQDLVGVVAREIQRLFEFFVGGDFVIALGAAGVGHFLCSLPRSEPTALAADLGDRPGGGGVVKPRSGRPASRRRPRDPAAGLGEKAVGGVGWALLVFRRPC